MRHLSNESAAIERMLGAKRIAVVGLSDNPARASFGVAQYLLRQGYEVIPVNPNCSTVLGRPAAKSLDAVDEIQVVNVFRRSEFAEQVVRDAIRLGASGVWLQLGVISEPARKLAEDARIDFVQDHCIKIEHAMRKS